MNALAQATVDVCPLGRSGRFGMTPEQQRIYLICIGVTEMSDWLDYWPVPPMREVAAAAGLHSIGGVHRLFAALVERGWLRRSPRDRGRYIFDLPIMNFTPSLITARLSGLPGRRDNCGRAALRKPGRAFAAEGNAA